MALLAPASDAQMDAAPIHIFNGNDLTGWRGREDLWSVQDGVITGQTTEANPIDGNTFLIYQNDVQNFDLTFEYKIINGNSGVQYRSKVIDEAKFVVGGYQADIDSKPRYSGINYEEKARGILADRGQITLLLQGDKPEELGRCGEQAALQTNIHNEDWNKYRVIAIDNYMLHFINGVLMSQVIDRSNAVELTGVLALQLHAGPPMKVQFKNLMLQNFEPPAAVVQ